MDAVYRQAAHRFRCEWGAEGVEALGNCTVLVVVDVLSFSTAATLVVERGGSVLPLRQSDGPAAAAARARGAVLAGDREWTLRPSSLTGIEPGVLFGLPSPNGATLCTLAARTGARVLVGCLRNAGATARAAVAALRGLRHDLAGTLADGVSGRELAAGGHAGDIALAAECDATGTVGELRDGVIGA